MNHSLKSSSSLCNPAWPRYRVLRVQELGQYNLEILSADLSDDSLYECQAPDAALRSRRAKLTVLSMLVQPHPRREETPDALRALLTFRSFPPPVPPDDPVIDGGPEVLLIAGESYNLSCVSRGAKPPSMIEWLKDGLPVDGAVSATVSSGDKLANGFVLPAIKCSDRVCCSASGGAPRQEESDDAQLPAHPARRRRHRQKLQLHRHQPGCSRRQEHNCYPRCTP